MDFKTVNHRIFSEWLPGNGRYEISANYNIKIDKERGINSPNYICDIHTPIKKKNNN